MIRARIGEIELGDLLRSLEAGGKSGIVTVQCPQIKGRIHLQGGKMAYVQTTPGPVLGEYLVRFEYLTVEQVQNLVRTQERENPGTPLGHLALSSGLITEEELDEVLHAQILDALATLLSQREGEILAEALSTQASQIVLSGIVDTSTMLMESLRRLDEWRRGAVNPQVVLKLVGDPTRHALSGDAWSVLERVDGAKRARSIALECDLPEEQVYHLLYELTSRGLLAEADIRPEDPLLLVMAESSLIRRLLLVSLERARYRVLLPQDLETALRMLELHRPQGILLESSALVEWVRQFRAAQNGKFVPLWAIAEQPPRGLWVRSARITYIPKPFSEDLLLEAISVIRRTV